MTRPNDTDQSQPASGAMNVDVFCKRHDVSRSFFYLLLRRGELKAVKAGSRTLITNAEAARWLSSLPVVA